MTSKVEQKLEKAGVKIPDAPSPAANYLPFTYTGNLIFVSGQVPLLTASYKSLERLAGMQASKTRKARQKYVQSIC